MILSLFFVDLANSTTKWCQKSPLLKIVVSHEYKNKNKPLFKIYE